tara:strand:+ start:18537 stop:19670 length:1134 start_codon:yes stop_codon:yes gene_type:complete
MNILYFFTFGYSLKTWNDSGQLNREIKHFTELHNKNKNLNFTLFTYGDETDEKFIKSDFIKVVPIYKYIKKSKFKIINFYKSFFITSIIRNLKLENSDTIIQNQLLGSWVSYRFKKQLKIPLIIRTGYDMYEFSIHENKNYLKRLFFKYLTNLSLRFSDIYSVTSKCDKEFLLNNFKKIDNSKIIIRPNWVELNNSSEQVENKKRNTKKIVSVGRLEFQKNYSSVIKALEGTDYELDIFGDGSLKYNLTKEAKKLNVKVNFLGVVDNKDLVKLLRNYKFYISSSIFEGNPKSILEAMSAGCVIIASDIKNHTEFLNEENALLFNNHDGSLKTLLHNLNVDEEKLNNLTNSSIKTLKSLYNLDSLVENEISDILELTS